jgi:hypothetical protein
MTWSRLEGLRFHWAVASGPKGQWELPPRGWKTLPDTTGEGGLAGRKCHSSGGCGAGKGPGARGRAQRQRAHPEQAAAAALPP